MVSEGSTATVQGTSIFIYLVRFYIRFARQWQPPEPPPFLPPVWRCQAAWPWPSCSRPTPARPNNPADCAPEPAVGIYPVARPARCPFPATGNTRRNVFQIDSARFQGVLPFVSLAASGKGVNHPGRAGINEACRRQNQRNLYPCHERGHIGGFKPARPPHREDIIDKFLQLTLSHPANVQPALLLAGRFLFGHH